PRPPARSPAPVKCSGLLVSPYATTRADAPPILRRPSVYRAVTARRRAGSRPDWPAPITPPPAAAMFPAPDVAPLRSSAATSASDRATHARDALALPVPHQRPNPL